MTEGVASQQETTIATGGSRGLGRGIVEALAARQLRVVAVARGTVSLEATAKEMCVEHLAADVADESTANVQDGFKPGDSRTEIENTQMDMIEIHRVTSTFSVETAIGPRDVAEQSYHCL